MDLLKMSFSGAILIMAVVVIRAATINKLPKNTFLLLWGIVLLRLTIPFSIPSVLSVYSFASQNISTDTRNEMVVSSMFPSIQEESFALTGEISAFPANDIHTVSIWFAVWLSGMILCTAFFAISYIRCRFEFQTSLPAQSEFINQWLKDHPLIRPVSIRQSDRISALLTYGIFRPVILMPKKTDWECKTQLQLVLLHEYVHICRFDALTKLISTLVLCIHWFNPFVWLMYIFFNRDIELACDESVIRKTGELSKSAYAHMLINMEARKSGLYYQFFWNIADKETLTVGERDLCISNTIKEIQDFWITTDTEQILNMTKEELVNKLQEIAAKYSNDRIAITIREDSVSFEKMDERTIRQ